VSVNVYEEFTEGHDGVPGEMMAVLFGWLVGPLATLRRHVKVGAASSLTLWSSRSSPS
jgi:hypothetical protein